MFFFKKNKKKSTEDLLAELPESYFVGEEYVKDPVRLPVEIHALFPSPGEISKTVLEVEGRKVFLEQQGSLLRVILQENISQKLVENIKREHKGDGWIIPYVAEVMPYVNREILNQRYSSAHFLVRTYSVMDISQLWVINKSAKEQIRVAWPTSLTGFPPLVELAPKYDRIYIRDLIDSMHSYFNGDYEECIRKAITSIETFIKYHKIEVLKQNGGLDFEKTLKTHMDILCPMMGEKAADVIWEGYKVRNDIVHDGKRLDPIEGKRIGKRVTHMVNEVYKNYGNEDELKRHAFYLEGQFLFHEEHAGDLLTLNWLEKNHPRA